MRHERDVAPAADAQLPDHEDRQLLGAIAAGSETALERFYRLHYGALHRYLLRTVRNASDAAELVNEVMLEVWRGAGRFSGGSRVKTWLFSIAHHRAIDLIRRRRPTEEIDHPDTLASDDVACSPALVLAGAQQAAHIRTCIERLPREQRDVVHLTFYEQLSYPEIAQVMAIPTGTVKTRMMHAKRKLEQCLQLFIAEDLVV